MQTSMPILTAALTVAFMEFGVSAGQAQAGFCEYRYSHCRARCASRELNRTFRVAGWPTTTARLLRRILETSQEHANSPSARQRGQPRTMGSKAWTIRCTPRLRNLLLPASRMSNASTRAAA